MAAEFGRQQAIPPRAGVGLKAETILKNAARYGRARQSAKLS
jgi:hypothetical protein